MKIMTDKLSHRTWEKTGLPLRKKPVARDKEEVKEPPLYKVLLHNDDYTTMDFVVMILETVFKKDTS